jgi:hypothetical protein
MSPFDAYRPFNIFVSTGPQGIVASVSPPEARFAHGPETAHKTPPLHFALIARMALDRGPHTACRVG